MKTCVALLSALIVWVAPGCSAPPPLGNVPASVERPDFRVGDRWSYQVRDGYNGALLRSFDEEIIVISDTQLSTVVDGDKTATYTAEGNPVSVWRPRSGLAQRYSPAYPAYLFPLHVGQTWKQTIVITDSAGTGVRASLYARAVGWERVSVPAGEFDALKVRREIYLEDEEFWRWRTEVTHIDWYVPAIKRSVRYEEESQFQEKSGRVPNNIRRGDWTIVELTGRK